MAAPQPRFLLDANVFIEASNRYYQHSICPGFWNALIFHFQDQSLLHSQRRSIMSIDKVKDEILLPVWLTEWIEKEASDEWFRSTASNPVQSEYKKVIEWASKNKQYTQAAKSKFADGADGWLVAYAEVHKCVVVTQETSSPESKSIIKLPDVCNQFGVECMNTFEMLNELGVQFDWTPPR